MYRRRFKYVHTDPYLVNRAGLHDAQDGLDVFEAGWGIVACPSFEDTHSVKKLSDCKRKNDISRAPQTRPHQLNEITHPSPAP